MLVASFNGLYFSLHITMLFQWLTSFINEHTLYFIFLSISPWPAAFGNHLMKMFLQLIFLAACPFPLKTSLLIQIKLKVTIYKIYKKNITKSLENKISRTGQPT